MHEQQVSVNAAISSLTLSKVIDKNSIVIGVIYNDLICIQNDNHYFEYCIACVAHALATETNFAINIQLTRSRDYTYR